MKFEMNLRTICRNALSGGTSRCARWNAYEFRRLREMLFRALSPPGFV